jgi:hypothetical protein
LGKQCACQKYFSFSMLQNRKQPVSKNTINRFVQIQDFKTYSFRHQTAAVNRLLFMNKFFFIPSDSHGYPSDHEPLLCSHWSATIEIILRCALYMKNDSASQSSLDMIKLSKTWPNAAILSSFLYQVNGPLIKSEY